MHAQQQLQNDARVLQYAAEMRRALRTPARAKIYGLRLKLHVAAAAWCCRTDGLKVQLCTRFQNRTFFMEGYASSCTSPPSVLARNTRLPRRTCVGGDRERLGQLAAASGAASGAASDCEASAGFLDHILWGNGGSCRNSPRRA